MEETTSPTHGEGLTVCLTACRAVLQGIHPQASDTQRSQVCCVIRHLDVLDGGGEEHLRGKGRAGCYHLAPLKGGRQSLKQS